MDPPRIPPIPSNPIPSNPTRSNSTHPTPRKPLHSKALTGGRRDKVPRKAQGPPERNPGWRLFLMPSWIHRTPGTSSSLERGISSGVKRGSCAVGRADLVRPPKNGGGKGGNEDPTLSSAITSQGKPSRAETKGFGLNIGTEG